MVILRESETGTANAELCRKHGISNNTLYNWRAKFGGMQSADVKRLRQLDEENMQMKKLLGEQALLIDGYKNALSKKYCLPLNKKPLSRRLKRWELASAKPA